MNTPEPGTDAAATPHAAGLSRAMRIEAGTRLTRRLGPLRGFPATLDMAGRSVSVTAPPELVLVVDLIRPPEGEYRYRHCYDVYCQLALGHEDSKWTNAVNVVSSRSIPPSEAAVVGKSPMPAWLNLEEVDDVVNSAVSKNEIRAKFRDSINDFSERWITEYSLQAINGMSDADVTAVLRGRDKKQYERLLAYLDRQLGVDADTIRKHVRLGLVAPLEIAALLDQYEASRAANAPRPAESFDRTMELRSERAKRDK